VAYPARPLLPYALALAFAATACGGAPAVPKNDAHHLVIPHTSGSPAVKTSPSAKPGAPSSAKPGATPGASSAPASGTSGTPKPGTSATPSSRPRPASDLTLKITLSKECVVPGTAQTVTVDVDLGNVRVLVDTLYADKKDGQTHGGFKVDGFADGKGHYSWTFTVLPGTPVGTATLWAAAGNDKHRAKEAKQFVVNTRC
jgi:hypothetical protein